MESMMREFLKGTDWTVENSSVLVCPCGYRVETDGKCPNGCRPPLPI